MSFEDFSFKRKGLFIVNKILLILKEQLMHYGIIFRVAKYEKKASYQGHYLGVAWEVLNPIIQILTYFLVFGLGIRRGSDVGEVPYLTWMLIGISGWFFLNKATLDCSNSIHRKIGMVSKMKFPVSILPAITIISLIKTFFVMTAIAILTVLSAGVRPSLYWLQFFYYFISMITFLYFFGLLNSTITILIRDYHFILQSIMRILFYFSGPILVIEEMFPGRLGRVLDLNPYFYIINGFRDSFLNRAYFWDKGSASLFFWLLTLLIAIIASHLHLKFRSKFVDLI